MRKQDCTVLLCSSDGYDDLWTPFFKLLHKYWKDCPYKIILNTESKSFQYPNLDVECFQLYQNKNIPYGRRMIEHLKRVKTPFTLVMMDDFFIRKPVNQLELDKVIEWMKQDEKIASFSFQHYQDELNCKSERFPGYERRPVYGEYKLNFQAAIWRTKTLLKLWKKHETPWEWETIANSRTFTKKWSFYVIDDDKHTPIDYGFKNSGMGVFRGKWVFDSVEKLFQDNGIEIDYSIRGIYSNKDKNIVRMAKEGRLYHEICVLKSIGLRRYFIGGIWRVKQQIYKILGLPYSRDYIDYMRKKKG